MRYIDVTIDGLVHNILAVDLRFKSNLDSVVNLSKPHTQNLEGVYTLDGAMEVLDNFVDETRVTVIDEDGSEVKDISRIVFDEVVVTGVNEVTVGLDGSLDRTINNINDNIVIYDGVSSLVHTFVHNMNTEFFKYNVWIQEPTGWQNSIAPITIIDVNTVKLELNPARPARIILENINDISKTHGL